MPPGADHALRRGAAKHLLDAAFAMHAQDDQLGLVRGVREDVAERLAARHLDRDFGLPALRRCGEVRADELLGAGLGDLSERQRQILIDDVNHRHGGAVLVRQAQGAPQRDFRAGREVAGKQELLHRWSSSTLAASPAARRAA